MSTSDDPPQPEPPAEPEPSAEAKPAGERTAAGHEVERQLWDYLGQRIDSLDRLAQAMRKRSGQSQASPGRPSLRSLVAVLGSASSNPRAAAWSQEALSIAGAMRWHRRKTRRAGSGGDEPTDRDALHRRAAMRVVKLCNQQGGAVTRFGQLAAHRRDLIAPVWTDTLAQLSSAEPVPYASIAAQVQRHSNDGGDWLGEVDPAPVCVTGITQLYTARHRDGRPLWLMVRVPDVARQWASDKQALDRLSRAIADWTGAASLARMFSELSQVIGQELDLSAHRLSLAQMAERSNGLPEVEVPAVVAELCSTEHIVTSRVDGPTLIEVGKSNHRLTSAWLDVHAHLIAGGHFVAEPHASWARIRDGNCVALSPAGLLTSIDRQGLAAVLTEPSDVAAISAALAAAGLASGDDKPDLLSAWRRALEPHAHPPSHRRQLLADALACSRTHGHELPYEWVRLSHALIVLSTWAVTLIGDDPAFDPVARVAACLSTTGD